MVEFISQPWHWGISGFLIALIMIMLLWFGGEFGVSGNLRTICSIFGAGKTCDFFDFNWKNQIWNLFFIGGAVIGGYIASHYLMSPSPVAISEATQTHLYNLGIQSPQSLSDGTGFVPSELFSLELKNIILLGIGGILIGFGTRYAGGCTSGHAISGLSNLQIPSLIAVIGFFVGGLIMTWFLLPMILQL